MSLIVPPKGLPSVISLLVVAALGSTMLAACGDKKDKPASQTAAKVNREEITVHQINAVLQQQRGLRPDQTDEASRRALERLIDQELAVQKAAEIKVDRDTRVVLAIEAARRDIIARAYIDKIGEGATAPTPGEVKAYYDDNPALFRERRVYQLQELAIEAPAAQVDELQRRLAAARTINDFVEYLKSNNIKFAASQAVRSAEQLPLSALPALAKLKDGQALLTATPTGAQVVVVAGSRLQPIDEERAGKAIEQFLLNERKRALVADDLKALRSAARIAYVGKFAPSAPAVADTVKAVAPAEVTGSAAAPVDNKSISDGLGLKAGSVAASAAEAADAAVKPASEVDASTISKGLGLK